MEDIGIRPRWDFLPGWVRELFASAVGTSVAVGLVICVVGFVIAGVMLIFARSQGMYGTGAQAKTRLLEVIAATIVIAGAVSLVAWFASIAGPSPDEPADADSGDGTVRAAAVDGGGVAGADISVESTVLVVEV